MATYHIYILMNKNNTVNYTGVTNNIFRRVYQHKNKMIVGFTSKYNINKLVYFEECYNPKDAIAREKQIKGWRLEKKLSLIKEQNLTLSDLAEDWF